MDGWVDGCIDERMGWMHGMDEYMGIGSPKMYGHMVKTRKKQFDLLKSGGKKKDGAADAKSSGSKGTKKQS